MILYLTLDVLYIVNTPDGLEMCLNEWYGQCKYYSSINVPFCGCSRRICALAVGRGRRIFGYLPSLSETIYLFMYGCRQFNPSSSGSVAFFNLLRLRAWFFQFRESCLGHAGRGVVQNGGFQCLAWYQSFQIVLRNTLERGNSFELENTTKEYSVHKKVIG